VGCRYVTLGRCPLRIFCSRGTPPPPYLTQSVFKVVVQTSIPTQSVNLFFLLVTVKDELTDLWGCRLVQNDFKNTLCEIRFGIRESRGGPVTGSPAEVNRPEP